MIQASDSTEADSLSRTLHSNRFPLLEEYSNLCYAVRVNASKPAYHD